MHEGLRTVWIKSLLASYLFFSLLLCKLFVFVIAVLELMQSEQHSGCYSWVCYERNPICYSTNSELVQWVRNDTCVV